MCPPAAAPLVDKNESNTIEELFMFMLCLAHGYPVPASVITDVNPFNCLPETLPDTKWYFMKSTENKGAEGGFWKLRGKAREIYGNASITGWQATHEFYKGQGSHFEKTNWLMLEYYITPMVSTEAVFAEDANSLCQVYCCSSSPLSDSENYVYSVPPDNFSIPTEQCATDQIQGHLTAVDTCPCNIMQYADGIFYSDLFDDLPEMDHLDPGDYLELQDLGTPQSPSSGSDNSSCVTMSSDDCFDYLEAMLDFEAESGDHAKHKDAGCNLNVSDSSQPDDIAVQAANSGFPIDKISPENARDGKAVNRDSSPSLTLVSQSSELLNGGQTPSADGSNKTDGRFKKLKRKYLPASSSQSSDGSNSGRAPSPGPDGRTKTDGTAASSSQSSDGSNSGRAPSPGPDGRTKTDGTLKKLQKKYLCFMPF